MSVGSITNMSHKVLLIGWDAADWKVINPLLDGGEMPNLERIAQFAFDLGARAPTINARIDPISLVRECDVFSYSC